MQETNVGQVTDAGKGQVRTEGGLVVPASSVEDRRARRAWLWQDWKTFRRTIQFFARERVSMVLSCGDCKAVMIPQRARVGEGYDLECKCKVREIRPGR